MVVHGKLYRIESLYLLVHPGIDAVIRNTNRDAVLK